MFCIWAIRGTAAMFVAHWLQTSHFLRFWENDLFRNKYENIKDLVEYFLKRYFAFNSTAILKIKETVMAHNILKVENALMELEPAPTCNKMKILKD